MNEHLDHERLCPGCAAEIVRLRALADDLAAVLGDIAVRAEHDGRDQPNVVRVLARYLEARGQ